MKRFLIAVGLFAAASPAFSADIGVSVTIGQPGFYGRIDIGNAPQPQLIFASPVVIRAAPQQVILQPVYLRVPPGHEKKWSKHCGKYNACGQPVYFVRDNWYTDVYAPHYSSSQKDKEKGKEKSKEKGKEKKNKDNRND